MISWFVLPLELLARLQNTWLHRLEDAGKPVSKFMFIFFLEGILSKQSFFCSEEGFHVRTTLLLFTINAPCQLPSHCEFWHLTAPNHHSHITIEPIVRCVRNPPIKNAHTYPCNYAGYQNELWSTHSQTVYTNDLDNAWVGCNAGYDYLVQPLSDFPQTKTLNQFKKVDFYSCRFIEWSHYNNHLWKLAVLG